MEADHGGRGEVVVGRKSTCIVAADFVRQVRHGHVQGDTRQGQVHAACSGMYLKTSKQLGT